MNSRAKGARGERLAAAAWANSLGIDPATCRRGQQFAGGTDSPDVVQPIAAIHLEVKNTERGNPYRWVEQAHRDASGKIPLVLHKRNGEEWLAIVRLSDVRRLAEEIHQALPAVGSGSFPPAIPGEDLSTPAIQDGGCAGVLRHVGGLGPGDHHDPG
jgi:hypothetical protein